MRVRLLGSMPVGTAPLPRGRLAGGGGVLPPTPTPGCSPVSWERVSDPYVKEVRAPERKL